MKISFILHPVGILEFGRKMNEMKNSKTTVLALSGATFFLALLLIAQYGPPSLRLWGYDGFAFFQQSTSLLWIAASLILVPGFLFLFRLQKTRMLDTLPYILLVLSFLLSLIFRDSTSLRGDGILYASDFQKGLSGVFRAPFTAYLIRLLIAMGASKLSASLFYTLLDAAFYLVYLYAAFRFLRRLASVQLRIAAAAAFGMSGILLLSAGLVESYAPVNAAAALGLVLSLEAIDRNRIPWIGLALVLLAAGFHLTASTLVPAFLLSLVPRIGRRRALILFGVSGVLGFVAFVLFMKKHLLFPFGAMPPDNYTVWAPSHLVDWLNIPGWAFPVTFFVLLPPLLYLRRPKMDNPGNLYLAGATLGALAFTFIFSPDLGMARDADLVSLPAIPLTMLVLRGLDRSERQLSPLIIALSLFVAAVGPISQLVLHSQPKPSIQRFVRMLERDPVRSGYGWESLALYFRNHGDLRRSDNAYGMAWKHANNWRYAFHLGSAAIRKNDFQTAIQYADTVIAIAPNIPDGYWLRGQTLALSGDRSYGLSDLKKAIDLGIVFSPAYALYAYQLLSVNNPVEAEKVLIQGSHRLKQFDATYYAAFIVTETMLGKYDSALRLEKSISVRDLPSPLREMTQRALITAKQNDR